MLVLIFLIDSCHLTQFYSRDFKILMTIIHFDCKYSFYWVNEKHEDSVAMFLSALLSL